MAIEDEIISDIYHYDFSTYELEVLKGDVQKKIAINNLFKFNLIENLEDDRISLTMHGVMAFHSGYEVWMDDHMKNQEILATMVQAQKLKKRPWYVKVLDWIKEHKSELLLDLVKGLIGFILGWLFT